MSDTVRVEVKTLPSGSHVVEVDRNTDVAALKERLVAETTVPANRQRLLYMGRELPNTESLASLLRSTDNSLVLHMVQRPRPEGAPSSAARNTSTSSTAGRPPRNRGPMAGFPPVFTMGGGAGGGGGGPPGGAMPFDMLPPEISAQLQGMMGGEAAPGGPEAAEMAASGATILGPFTFEAGNPEDMMNQMSEIGAAMTEQVNNRLSDLLPRIPRSSTPSRGAGSRRSGTTATAAGDTPSATTSGGDATTSGTTGTTGGRGGRGSTRGTATNRPARNRHTFYGLDRLLLRMENVNMEVDPLPPINSMTGAPHRVAANASRWAAPIASFVRNSRPILLPAAADLPPTTLSLINRVYTAARIDPLPVPGVRSFPVPSVDTDDEEDGMAIDTAEEESNSSGTARGGGTTASSTTGTSGSAANTRRGNSVPSDWHLSVSDQDLLAVSAATIAVLLRRFLGPVLSGSSSGGSGNSSNNSNNLSESNAMVMQLADRLLTFSEAVDTNREDMLRTIGMAASYLYRMAAVAGELSRSLQYLGSGLVENNMYIMQARTGYITVENRRPYPYVPRPMRPETSFSALPPFAIGTVTTATSGPFPAGAVGGGGFSFGGNGGGEGDGDDEGMPPDFESFLRSLGVNPGSLAAAGGGGDGTNNNTTTTTTQPAAASGGIPLGMMSPAMAGIQPSAAVSISIRSGGSNGPTIDVQPGAPGGEGSDSEAGRLAAAALRNLFSGMGAGGTATGTNTSGGGTTTTQRGSAAAQQQQQSTTTRTATTNTTSSTNTTNTSTTTNTDVVNVNDVVQRISDTTAALDVPSIASEIATSVQASIQAAASGMEFGETPRDTLRAATELASVLGPQIAGQVRDTLAQHLERIRNTPEVLALQEDLRRLTVSAPPSDGTASSTTLTPVETEAPLSTTTTAPEPAAETATTTTAVVVAPSTSTAPAAAAVPKPAPSGLGLGGGLGRKPKGGPSALPPRPTASTSSNATDATTNVSAGSKKPAAAPNTAATTTAPSAGTAAASEPSAGNSAVSLPPRRTAAAPAGAGGGGGFASLVSGLLDSPQLMQMANSPAMQSMAERMMGGMQSGGSGGGLDIGSLMSAAGPLLGALGGGGMSSTRERVGGGTTGTGSGAAGTTTRVLDVDDALSVLPAADAARWRELLERDEAAQADLVVNTSGEGNGEGKFSEAYIACMPPRYQGGGMLGLLGLDE